MSNKPVIILSRPSLSQNIGAAARAMLNFGLTEMRVVEPQTKVVCPSSLALAAGADKVLKQAKVYQNIADGIADLHRVYAATARPRDMIKEFAFPKDAAVEINQQIEQDNKVGILFGAEKSGLSNEEVARCDKIITVPLNIEFSSINLAQSVIIVAYELFQQQSTNITLNPLWDKDEDFVASKKEICGLLDQLEQELDSKKYFRAEHKKTIMMRNLVNFFSKSNATSQEIQTLRGVVSYLSK